MYDPTRPPPGSSAVGRFLTPAVKVLLAVTVAAYAAELVAINWLDRPEWVARAWLVPRDVIERGWAWQVVTFLFLHDPFSPWHLLLNLLGLVMFGGPMERRWGAPPFIRFYLVSGVVSGLTVLGAGWFLYPDVPTIGCSGSVLALAAAFGIVYRDVPVFLFGILPMRARTLLLVIVAMVVFDGLTNREGISVAGHAGGLAAGALLVTGWWRPSRWFRAMANRRSERPRVRFERRNGTGSGWVN